MPKNSAGNEAVEPVFAGAVFAAAAFLAGALDAFFATAFAAFFAGFAVAMLLLSLHRVAHNYYAAVWTRN